ncbi:MAG: bifunctional phosphoribosylaminoimidazolecarboxamide formyltransferase/IMP cyclohydrolase [Fimbriimonadia bacterium]|jgi:phosphoribosylaminoimidazolecarboxamide formyltransferase/IMP cyclohydrolase
MRRALLSVWDKTGIEEFARGLADLGFELISTGGTAAKLREAGLTVNEVSKVTGFPEIMDGRVKTLHPAIHAGLLADPSVPDHLDALERLAIGRIEVLVVNLYPFRETIAKGATRAEAIEMIDIGGPAMLRAAAKNHAAVAAVCDPADYPRVLGELRREGQVMPETRAGLALKAFSLTARYDAAIAEYLGEGASDTLALVMPRCRLLRYGENPDQQAAAYLDPDFAGASALSARVLGGKELSYNNILDADAAIEAALTFAEPAAVVVKHLTPCGVALADTPATAVRRAVDADPASAFGGVVAINRSVDEQAAAELTAKNQFLEVIAAPHFEDGAAGTISARSGWGGSVRLLEFGDRPLMPGWSLRSVAGGVLRQSAQPLAPFAPRTMTRRQPTDAEMAEMEFAWRVVRYMKSNGIVVTSDRCTRGVGSGQTSRVASVRIALEQAGEAARGAVLASDGFFPFPDSIELAAAAGIVAVVQPGGSKRDEDVIRTADALGLAMVFTDCRQFRH